MTRRVAKAADLAKFDQNVAEPATGAVLKRDETSRVALRTLDLDGLGGVPVKMKSGPSRKRNFKRALDTARADAMIRITRTQRKDPEAWADMTANTLVGVYAELHLKIYGVEAAELVEDFQAARSSAQRLCSDLGSVTEALECLRWVMGREKRSIDKNGPKDFRAGWRYCFGKKVLTDYRVWKGSSGK